MNSKLLTIICLIVIFFLFSTFSQYRDSGNMRLRNHQQQNTISGRIISSYGIPIQTKMEMSINDKKYQFSSDKEGTYVVQFPEGKNTEKYTASISTSSLLLGYSYQNPISVQVFTFQQGNLKLADIILNESGFGQIIVKGSFNAKLGDIHLQLSVIQDKKKLQANAISTNQGVFEFRIYGIKNLPLTTQLSVIDNLQLYEPIENLPIQIDGVSTIVQVKPIELQLSKSCRLIGCKTCNANNQKCSECNYAYRLDNSQFCKFGTFKGVGDVSLSISNLGQIIKIVGTLLDSNYSQMKDQVICLQNENNDCVATGGTNHLGLYKQYIEGQFEMLVQSLKVGILKYKFIVNNFSRDIEINGDESVQNLGLITIY